ncbi:unnamed protein product [Calypogeia fissa]
MKISLKVREERRPIIRAKLPLNVLGLPVFTGVTSGDQEELALHLGTDVQAGPSFRVSYKPNNVISPFSVLVKTGFGLWGSPNGAALAMSAEFDLNSSGSPSFSVRMKPKFGDFGFRKDTGRFKTSYESVASRISRGTSSGGDKMISMDNSGEEQSQSQLQSKSLDADLTLQEGHEQHIHEQQGHEPDCLAVSTNDKAHGNGDAGSFEMEKAESLTNGILEKSDNFERSSTSTTPEKVKRISDPSPSDDEGPHHYSEQVMVESNRNAVTLPMSTREVESGSVGAGLHSRFEAAAKGWRFNAHSSLPLGSLAVSKVRWQVKFGSTFFNDVRHGMRITDIKLPSLAFDKVSFEAVNPNRNRRSSTDVVDLAGLGYGCDDGTQLGRIASMCASMRYQIQLLHLENKFLKNNIDEWRGDVPRIRGPGSKGADLMKQEETALRSQMFDELNGKFNSSGSGNPKLSGGKSRDGRYGKDGDSQSGSRPSIGKGTSSGEEFTISKDPSEELQKAILNATGGGH